MRLAQSSTLALIGLLAASCHSSHWSARIDGEGPYVQTRRELATFEEIDLAGGMQLDVIVGGPQSVVIHADENLHEYIETRVDGDTLKIRITASLSTSNDLRAEISVSHLTGVEIAGSSRMSISGIDAEEFEIEVAGSAKGMMSGRVRELSVDVAGSSNLDLFELQADNVEIDIAGSGRIDVSAADSLDVDIAGSGVVKYRGHPSVSLDQAGSGKVTADNEGV